MNQSSENNNTNADDIEKDIEKSIEEMKSRDKYPWPEKKYKEIENEKVTPMLSVKNEYDKRNKKDKTIILLLTIISVLLLIISSMLLIGNNKIRNIEKRDPVITAQKSSQIINDIKFSIDKVNKKSSAEVIDLSVSNKSKNNFYFTINAISLIDENGKEYYPNLYKGELSESFFGKKILPNTKQSAKIVFDNVPGNKKFTLVINNVSDLYHYTWNYMITVS